MPQNVAASEKLQEPIVIRVNRANVLLAVIGSLAICLAGIWLLSISRDHTGKNYSAGWMAPVFGGLCLLVFLFRLFAPWPLLTIDAQGMHYRTFFLRLHTIAWEEIDMIYRYQMRYNQYLSISLSPAGKQTYLARNFKNGRGPFSLLQEQSPQVISIPFLLSTMPYDKITELLHKHYGKQIRSNRIQIETKSPF